jgi:hypothetical protein
LEKASFDLKYQNLRIPDEEQRNQADQEDCKDIAGSIVSLVTLGALFLLADIAARFAKWVYGLVENVPLVKNVTTILKDFKKSVGDFSLADQPGGKRGGGGLDVGPEGGPRPRDVTPEPAKAGEPARTGEPARKPREPEPAKAAEPETKVSENAAANAEKKGVPREQFEVEVRELNQKASNPDNIRDPADPRFDAEMDAQGHTYDREKGNRTWCRFSDPACGLDGGGDLNAKVDKAKAEKAAEGDAGKPAEAKPAEEVPAAGETKPGEAPADTAAPVDPKRAQLEADLAAAEAKKTAAQAKANDLKQQADAHTKRANELEKQAAISKGEKRTQLMDEARKAREAAKQAAKDADGRLPDRARSNSCGRTISCLPMISLVSRQFRDTLSSYTKAERCASITCT